MSRRLMVGAVAALVSIGVGATALAQVRGVRGQVRAGAIESESGSGYFDSSIVIRQLRARLRAIQTCYERELRDDPSLEGEVAVRFSIDEGGLVQDVSAVRNSTGSDAVADCAIRTIRRFRFNPGAEGGSVTFVIPLTFQKLE